VTTKNVPKTARRDVVEKSEGFLTQIMAILSGVPYQITFGATPGKGHYHYIGEGVQELLGVAPSEFTEELFIGSIEEIIPLLPEIPRDPLECRKKMIKGGLKYYTADLHIRTRAGTRKWINDCSIPIQDERTGDVVGAFGILTDISGRKRMEEALRASEERYRSLFDRMMDGVYRSTHDGRFIDINHAMVKMFGYASKEDMLKVDIKKDLYFSPADRESLFLDTGQEKIEIFPMRRKDGTAIWVEDHGQYIHDESGNVLYHEGILRDVTERMRAEHEIDEWKRRYELVASASRQVVYDYNISNGAIAWSGSVKQVLGYDVSEMTGGVDQWVELINPQDRERAIRLLDEARDNVTPYEVEYNFKHRDGRNVLIHDLGLFITDAAGKAVRMIGVMQDITERKQTELLQNAIYRISHAADKAESLEELFKSVHEIISTVMPAKNFYISLYDAEKDLITFPYFIDEIDPPSPPVKPGKTLTAYVLRTGKSLFCDEETDAELRRRGAVELIGAPSAIWMGVPLIIEDKPIGVMVAQHYTDPKAYTKNELHMLEYVSSQVAKAIQRKQAEESLRLSEEQFRLISENVADMIAMLDLDGKRLYNSPSYKIVLDDPDNLQGTDSFQEIHPEDRERIRQIFLETVRTGRGQRAEYRFITKDGDTRHIESQGSVIKNKDGNVSKVLVVSRDVTEKKKLEQQFLRSQRMESIGTLAGGIAHDLNNVLAPIMLSIQVLRNKTTNPDALSILDTLSSTAKRGSEVVKQVLTFSRGIEGERLILQPKHVIDEVVKITSETFPRMIEIRSSTSPKLWTLSADPTQIHQVLLNVFVNARDAMPYGGKIAINAENIMIDENYARMNLEARPGPYVCIAISDTGTGIPQKILDKIFEPFFTTKEVGKGTGLGLSTVLAIVKSHGGFLDVYSEVGKGTTFKVYLPAQKADQQIPEEDKKPEQHLGRGELILVVDDEASIREITKDTLEANGYKVLTASDGTEAVALYAQERTAIKVVITDMMMPIMDGTATIRALQKIDPGVKIIASSGMVPNDDIMKNTNVVKEILIKPYTTEKLLSALANILQPPAN
jgi:two-component system cell cycle sensor histidine kinase/response regulator CckA